MKFFVTADNHLGKNLKKRKVLRDYALNNFKNIPNMIDKDIDYVIFAGDVFDKENADIECCKVYLDVLNSLVRMKNIKNIFVISGNHDSYNDYYSNAAIEIANSIGSDKILAVSNKYKLFIDIVNKLSLTLIPWNKKLFLVNEGERRNIDEYINNIIFDNRNDLSDYYNIMVSHFPVIDWMPFATHGMKLEELQKNDFFNLILLGDLHNENFEDLNKNVDVVYTGSTMQTSIEDLRTHINCAKILEIKDGELKSVVKVPFNKPDVYVMDSETFDESKINEKNIIITNDINIHMNIKDRCLYSLYKPVVNINDPEEEGKTEAFEEINIDEIAKNKIDSDETIDAEAKTFLKNLLGLDTESMSSEDIQDSIKSLLEEGERNGN